MSTAELSVGDELRNFVRKNMKQLIVLGVVLLAYMPTLIWMYDRWFAADSYYSHGVLIPFVSGYLIWQRRKELTKIKIESSVLGIPLILAGLLIHLASSLFRVYFTSGFSFLIVLVGLIMHFYGSKIFRKVMFPVLFLFFMIPMPLVIIRNISFKMKVFAAIIAEGFLNKIGILAVRDGSIIKMKHAYVIVDDVCSGLRSLISLTALGSIFAYWMDSTMIRRVTLFLTTIPIAVITNVFRIVFLSFIAEVWGPEYAVGFTHDASGFLVFALAFVLLYVAGRLLE